MRIEFLLKPEDAFHLPGSLLLSQLPQGVPLHHQPRQLRHPQGIYSVSVAMILKRLRPVLDRLENPPSPEEFPLTRASQWAVPVLDDYDAFLDSMMEHMDDCQSVLKCFFASTDDWKAHIAVKQYNKDIEEYRRHVGMLVNHIKHKQGRLRAVFFYDETQVIPGYFAEGVLPSGDVPPGSVQVAYSNQLLEHLHPDDAAEQIREVLRALTPGGCYIAVTPHRFSGPHDVSRLFDYEAHGVHLKEYTYRELRAVFLSAGFASTSRWMGIKGHFFRLPDPVIFAMESLFAVLPRWLRTRLARTRLFRPLFGDTIIVGICSAS